MATFSSPSRDSSGRFRSSKEPKAKPVQVWLKPDVLERLDTYCAFYGVGRGRAIGHLLQGALPDPNWLPPVLDLLEEAGHTEWGSRCQLGGNEPELALFLERMKGGEANDAEQQRWAGLPALMRSDGLRSTSASWSRRGTPSYWQQAARRSRRTRTNPAPHAPVASPLE